MDIPRNIYHSALSHWLTQTDTINIFLIQLAVQKMFEVWQLFLTFPEELHWPELPQPHAKQSQPLCIKVLQ